MTSTRSTPIAVVGLGAVLPESLDVGAFYTHLLSGQDCLREIPPDRWRIDDYFDKDPRAEDRVYARRGGFLPDVAFDPLAWGVPPSVVPATDSTQLLALVVAEQVVRDAFGGRPFDRERTSVILGVTGAQKLVGEMTSRLQRPAWRSALLDMGLPPDQVDETCRRIAARYVPWQENTFPGVLGNVVAGRIANRLDLGGTNCVVDAACASTMGALRMAMDELTLRHSDLVLCGGADTMNDPFMFMCFAKTTALSPTGDCRPFSERADGTMLAEGVVMFALTRLEDAEAQGHPIYAVIRGIGSSSDGRAKSVYAPRSSGQARAIRRAYEAAGFPPSTVGLVEAHGTGTVAGDAAEFAGLREAFAKAEPAADEEAAQGCALGSVKSQIGHAKAAAGAAGMLKAILALRHGALLPTAKVERPNPSLRLAESPFYLNTEARPWIARPDEPRRAAVSAFGFGGSNFHVALEAYEGPHRAPRVADRAPQLFPLSAPDRAGLVKALEALRGLRTEQLAYRAHQLQGQYEAKAHARAALVAADAAELDRIATKALERLPAGAAGGPTHLGRGFGVGFGPPSGPVALLFPGQGSQYVGMGAALAMRFDRVRKVWERANRFAVKGRSLADYVFPPPSFAEDSDASAQAALRATEVAQPALAAASAGVLELLRAMGLSTAAAAGHSFGEVTALYASGAFDEAELQQIAQARGRLMREAAGERAGAMLAVSAGVEEVRAWLSDEGLPLSVANHNHPRQVVLSGPLEGVAEAQRQAAEKGWGTARLDVATAFHSPMVAAAAERFLGWLEGRPVRPSAHPVFANERAAAYPASPAAVRATLARQLSRPVRFVEMVQAMHEAGCRTFVEVGPQDVLSRLVGRILGDAPHHAVATDRRGEDAYASFLFAVAHLLAVGQALRFDVLWEEYRAPLPPAAPKAHALQLSGANYGKPDLAAAEPAPEPRVGSKSAPQPAPTAPRENAAPPSPLRISKEGIHMSNERANGRADVPAAPRTPAPAASTATSAPPADRERLSALLEVHRQTTDAHAAYQRAMAESHQSFLRAAEATLRGLSPHSSVEDGLAETPRALEPLPRSPLEPARLDEREAGLWRSDVARRDVARRDVARPDVATPDAAPPEPPRPPELEVVGAAASESAPRETAASVVSPATSGEDAPRQAADLADLVREVVSHKTGYPPELLDDGLDLESDLGIDSIKRVEILSAVRERMPGLGELDAARLGRLRTLREVIAALGGVSGPGQVAPPETARPELKPEASTPQAFGAPSTAAVLREVIATKTGYPPELLDDGLDLESDLGIDSIKRVEILSAVRERMPALGAIDAGQLGRLRTLREIIDALGGSERPADAAPPPDVVAAPDAGRPRDAVDASDALAAPTASAPQFEVGLLDAAAPGLAPAALFEAPVYLVFAEAQRALAEALRAALVRAGVDAALGLPPASLERPAVLDLSAMAPVGDVEEAYRVLEGRFRFLRSLASPSFYACALGMGGDLGIEGRAAPALARLGGLSGLVKSARLEWPDASVRVIDIASAARPPQAVAEALARELLTGAETLEVGLLPDGRRVVPELRPRSEDTVSAEGDRPVVLASGGARGVTATSLIALARKVGGSYLLLGRTPLCEETDFSAGVPDEGLLAAFARAQSTGALHKRDAREVAAAAKALRASREVRRTLEALAAAGATAEYAATDVRGPGLADAVAAARARFGPFTHLVHGAGVLADRPLREKSDEDYARVVDTKARGLDALLRATECDPLRSIVLFSSVAARFGNRGQTDYALANALLDAVASAEAQRRPGAAVRALAFGPWDGGMVDASLRARFEARGIAVLAPAAGADAFVQAALSAPGGSAQVVIGSAQVVVGDAWAERPEPPRRLAFSVGGGADDYLDDHRVEGTPVLPVALAFEHMVRAARLHRPGWQGLCAEGLEVVRGIRLPDLERAHPFFVSVRTDGEALAIELCGDAGVHYRVRIREGEASSPAANGSAPEVEAPTNPIYGGALFHGPRFQAIRRLTGFGAAGAHAEVVGARAMGWPMRGWVTDPMLLDAALQLAVLWSADVLGGPTLPTSVDQISLSLGRASGASAAGACRAELRAGVSGSGAARCDVVVTERAGGPRMVLRGVRTHLRPGARGEAWASEPQHSRSEPGSRSKQAAR